MNDPHQAAGAAPGGVSWFNGTATSSLPIWPVPGQIVPLGPCDELKLLVEGDHVAGVVLVEVPEDSSAPPTPATLEAFDEITGGPRRARRGRASPPAAHRTASGARGDDAGDDAGDELATTTPTTSLAEGSEALDRASLPAAWRPSVRRAHGRLASGDYRPRAF